MTAAAAYEARDIGMQRSSERADRECADWTKIAYDKLVSLRDSRRLSQPVLGEAIRGMAYASGVPKPPDERAWGPVFGKARKQGLLDIVGHANAKSSNMSPKPLWMAVAA